MPQPLSYQRPDGSEYVALEGGKIRIRPGGELLIEPGATVTDEGGALPATTLADLGVTSTAAELNKLDGASADVTAENLNVLAAIGFRSVSVPLTHAEIRGIPGSPKQILAAQGANKIILPLWGFMTVSLTAVYINPGDPIQLALGKHPTSTYIGASNLLTNATGTFWVPISYPKDAGGNTEAFDFSLMTNQPLVLYDDDNDGGASYTGGDPANEATITVYYIVVDVS